MKKLLERSWRTKHDFNDRNLDFYAHQKYQVVISDGLSLVNIEQTVLDY